jgi:hypothetical protein
VNFIP